MTAIFIYRINKCVYDAIRTFWLLEELGNDWVIHMDLEHSETVSLIMTSRFPIHSVKKYIHITPEWRAAPRDTVETPFEYW